MDPKNLEQERIALILVDAFALGDSATAKRWGVSTRTIQRYRSKVAEDPALEGLLKQKLIRAEADWTASRVNFLRKAIAQLEKLVEQAGPEQIREVVGAIKIVGELQITGTVLEPGTDSEGRAAAEAQAGALKASAPLR